MSDVRLVKDFITERLTAAATEIFGVFERTIIQYEDEIKRQRKLLDVFMKPEIKLHRIDAALQHHHVLKGAVADQHLYKRERSPCMDQKEPKPTQFIEELCTNDEGEQLILTQNLSADTAYYGESNNSEPESNCDVIPSYTDISQQHDVKVEFLADQQVCDQQMSSSVQQEEPEPLQIKEEPCTTHEEELLVLKKESIPSTLMANYDECDHSEPQPNSDMVFSANSTDMGKDSVKCKICGKAYFNPLRLKNHEQTHTNEKPLAHKSVNNAAIYMKKLSGDKPFSCQICGRRFAKSTHCVFHIRTHTGEKPYSCKICGRRFTQSNNAVRHEKTHTAERPYSCKICGKLFRHRISSVRHMKKHTGAASCKTCGEGFNQAINYYTHMKIHAGRKPYSCKICGKSFNGGLQLTVHMRIHTGEKPYSCKICGKSFTQQGNAIRHMRTHTDERPYSCKICERVFRYSYDLTVHMRSHTGEKPYSCEICGHRFSKRGHIITHMRTHPGEKSSSIKMYGRNFPSLK